MRSVPVGARGNFEQIVGPDDLASRLDRSLADVMSTPTMAAMMELAAIRAIAPYLDPGESSVGMSLDIQHIAATPAGHLVRAEAEVTKSEGRRLEFKVRAIDEAEEVGSGVHRRAVIDAAKFNERVRPKMKT
jgi:fluoroacetyl-CoA thioesterase